MEQRRTRKVDNEMTDTRHIAEPEPDTVPRSRLHAVERELREAKDKIKEVRANAWGLIEEMAKKNPELMIWQPIATAPKDGTHVLVCDVSSPFVEFWMTFNQRPPAVMHWFDNGHMGLWALSNGDKEEVYLPTHWMPLPPPPAI